MEIEFLLNTRADDNDQVAHLLDRFFAESTLSFYFYPLEYSDCTYRWFEQNGFLFCKPQWNRAFITFTGCSNAQGTHGKKVSVGVGVCPRIVGILRHFWNHRQMIATYRTFHASTFWNPIQACQFHEFFVSRGFPAILSIQNKNSGCESYGVFVGLNNFHHAGQYACRQPNMRLPVVTRSLSLFLPRDVIVHVILPYVSRN